MSNEETDITEDVKERVSDTDSDIVADEDDDGAVLTLDEETGTRIPIEDHD